MQAVGSAVLRISIRLREMVNGAAGVVRPFRVRRRNRTLITEIEEYFRLGRELGHFHPDQRQLIRAVPFLDIKLEFGCVVCGDNPQVAAIIVRGKKVEVSRVQPDQHRCIRYLASRIFQRNFFSTGPVIIPPRMTRQGKRA